MLEIGALKAIQSYSKKRRCEMEQMEQEKLQPIDLEVLLALYKKAYLPKTADKISKDLNIDYQKLTP